MTRRYAALMMITISIMMLVSCGGGGGGSSPTPPGQTPGTGEGTIASPVSIGTATTTLSRTSDIGALADSYVSFTTGTAGVYTISLLTGQSDLSWQLYNVSANFSGLPKTSCDADNSGNEICFTSQALSAATAYHLKIHNYGAVSSNYTLVIAPPAAPITSFPVTAGFETGLPSGWLASGTWAVTGATAYSGSYSITDSPGVNYLNNANMYLMSPLLDLTGIVSPTLSYYHKYDLESARDYADVEVSTNGGISFVTVKTYTGTVVSWPSYTHETVSLSAYKTNQVVIRFLLTSDISVVHDGWYLDDIVIQ